MNVICKMKRSLVYYRDVTFSLKCLSEFLFLIYCGPRNICTCLLWSHVNVFDRWFSCVYWVASGLESYRKLRWLLLPAPVLKSLRLLRLHFLPRQHLNSASHFTQNEGYVSQTGSNWPLPWFPLWKEQLEKGGARTTSGCVTWPCTKMSDVIWCIWH